MDLTPLETRGWMRFKPDLPLLRWAMAAREAGLAVLADPEMRARWLQCRGTWFVGVDALPTAQDGSIGGKPLAGAVIDALAPLPPLHTAQLSVIFPGYPQPREGESLAAFNYREKRFAAHVDGITAEGPERRRYVTEPHGFVLGVALSDASPGAAPLTVWDRSHVIMREAIAEAWAKAGTPPEQVDVTEVYTAARRVCFETCQRVSLAARSGEALLLHRHLLHGIAPWQPDAPGPSEGRMVAYFRPPARGGHAAWISDESIT